MRSDDDDSNNDNSHLLNLFVRFKHHVDSTFASAFNTMTSFPESHSSYSDAARSFAREVMPLLYSPSYSPAALRHLPQPVPNDLPEGRDGSIFTFEDAFEDLLATSLGQPLPDIHLRYGQRKLLQHMFPSGEPRSFWVRRLTTSGLLGPKPQETQARIDAMDPLGSLLHTQLERRAEEVWGRSQDDSARYSGPREANLSGTEIIETLSRLTEAFVEGVDIFNKSMKAAGIQSRRRDGPDHSDDLYLSLEDSADSGKRSWDTFMEKIREPAGVQEKQRPANTSPGTKVEESRDEHVDKHGYVHSKVTRRELDSDGNELSRMTSYEIHPSPDRNSEANQGRVEGADNDQGDHGKDEKKSGWFWK